MIDALKIISIIIFALALIYEWLFAGFDAKDLGAFFIVGVFIILWAKWTWQMFTLCFFLAGIAMLAQGGIGIIFGFICLAIGILFLSALLGKAPDFKQMFQPSEKSKVPIDKKNERHQVINKDISKSYKPEQLKCLRESLGRTQDGMAQLLGTSIASWQRWETGASTPPPEYQDSIRKLMEYADIIKGDDSVQVLSGPVPGSGIKRSISRQERQIPNEKEISSQALSRDIPESGGPVPVGGIKPPTTSQRDAYNARLSNLLKEFKRVNKFTLDGWKAYARKHRDRLEPIPVDSTKWLD